jgi:hypothetical protein
VNKREKGGRVLRKKKKNEKGVYMYAWLEYCQLLFFMCACGCEIRELKEGEVEKKEDAKDNFLIFVGRCPPFYTRGGHWQSWMVD